MLIAETGVLLKVKEDTMNNCSRATEVPQELFLKNLGKGSAKHTPGVIRNDRLAEFSQSSSFERDPCFCYFGKV